MIAPDLEVSLHMAFVESRQKRYEFITVEHLLLAMLDNASAVEVLNACLIDIADLREVLMDHVVRHTPVISGSDEVDTQPTLGFQRVIQETILHVQSSGKRSDGSQCFGIYFWRKRFARCLFFGTARSDAFRCSELYFTQHSKNATRT